MTAFKWDDTKPGPQMAAVWVSEERGNGFYVVVEKGYCAHIDARALHPLPPSLSPEQAAVIEAAEKWANGDAQSSNVLLLAVEELHASRAPRDPVAEAVRRLVEYAERYKMICEGNGHHDMAGHTQDAIDAAIAALSEKGT